MAEYVDPRTGEEYTNIPDEEVGRAKEQFGLVTKEDWVLRQKYGSTAEQAKGLGKLAARTATFGTAYDTPEDAEAIKATQQNSPTLSTLATVAGAAAPAMLAAPLASGAAAAMGLSGRAAALGASVAEEFAGNSAFEMADAREQDRQIDFANIVIGTGLGTGISMAARAARGGLKAFGAPKADGVLDAASSESQWLSKGRKVSGERRSVGAAGADDVRKPATAREVEAYAAAPEEFHAQVNQAGHDALADAFTGNESVTGSSGGAARQVHGLAFKEQDVIPHMLDVDPATALGAVNEHVQAAMRTAEAIKKRAPAVARRIQAQAEAALKGMDGVEETMMGARGAVGLNRLKQELDDVTNNFLQMKGAEAKSAGKELQKTANALRANLQDKKTWGEFWAERQTNENALWSGDNGIIQKSNSWQPEVFQSVKGKAWVKIDDQLSQAMNRTPRTNLAEHFRDMDKIKANKVLNDWESTVDRWERMTELKEESGLVRAAIEATGESPVDVLKKSLAEQRQIIEELRFIHEAAPRAKPILDKLAASGAAKAQGELIFDAASELPGVGGVLKAADKAKKVLTGKSIREGFTPDVLPPAKEFDRAASLQAISERQAARGKRVVIEPKGPQGGPTMPPNVKRAIDDGTLSTEAQQKAMSRKGELAEAKHSYEAALKRTPSADKHKLASKAMQSGGVMGISPEDFIKEISGHSQTFTDAMGKVKARQGQSGAVTMAGSDAALRKIKGKGISTERLEQIKGQWIEKGPGGFDNGARYYRIHKADEPIGSVLGRTRKDRWVDPESENFSSQPRGISSASSLESLNDYKHYYSMGVQDDDLILEMRGRPGGEDADRHASRVIPEAVRVVGTGKDFKRISKGFDAGHTNFDELLLPDPPKATSRAGQAGMALTSPMAVAAGGALAVAGGIRATSTDHLAEISDNSRAITERAALGLTVKESRAPKLRPLAERFKDGAPDLNAAFRMKTNELRQIIEDPMSYVQGMTAAFGQIASEHPGLFMQMVERTTIGAHYLQANLPPSVGISMVHPNGIAPDSLAVMKFAAMYNAVFSPGDVVYDVGTGDATPTQIRALKQVHPDIYNNLRTDVLKQISQVGQKVPFETLRGLDNLFDFPGVAGLAFSPAMTATMAGAYADKQTPPKQSLGGESSIAPDLASSKLAGLSAVR